MDDSKVLLFGSFTENETKSFQKLCLGDTKAPVKTGLQFGSLDFAALGSSVSFGAQSKQTNNLNGLVPLKNQKVKSTVSGQRIDQSDESGKSSAGAHNLNGLGPSKNQKVKSTVSGQRIDQSAESGRTSAAAHNLSNGNQGKEQNGSDHRLQFGISQNGSHSQNLPKVKLAGEEKSSVRRTHNQMSVNGKLVSNGISSNFRYDQECSKKESDNLQFVTNGSESRSNTSSPRQSTGVVVDKIVLHSDGEKSTHDEKSGHIEKSGNGFSVSHWSGDEISDNDKPMSPESSSGSTSFPPLSSALTSDEDVANGTRHVTKHVQPRGLVNLGNLCFLNATLQALLSCSQFVQLLQKYAGYDIPKIGYPTLLAFVELIAEFEVSVNANLKTRVEVGRPLSPIMFEPILKKFTPDMPSAISGRPRQEDAQEFLSFVMDQMHDELLKLKGHLSYLNGGSSSMTSFVEDEDWETVGPKNKSAVTRTQSFVPSELSEIFGGQLRSVVKAKGNKASATVQPFLLLHLDIYPDAVHTIEDALHLFSAPEALEGYKTSTGKAEVDASKSVKIQTLPKILILHLMRFSYGSTGSLKLHKPVRFPLDLVLGRDLLVSPTTTQSRKYELVATITHVGREPSRGHYVADTRHAEGRWLRFDDAAVSFVGWKKILHDQAYVLFYRQV